MKSTTKHANFYFLLFTFTFLLFSLNGFAQTPIVPPSGLVGWWSGDGNTNDIAGTNNGAFVGVSDFAVGKVGQNFKFQSNLNTVQVPDDSTLDFTNAFTIEMWVAPTEFGSPSGTTFFISKGNFSFANTQSYGIIFGDTGRIVNRVGNGSTIAQLVSNASLPLNTFSHIATTYDGTTLRIYINGVLDNSQATSIGNLINTTQPLFIGGADLNGTTIFARSAIDETSLYNRALSDTEIASIFNAGLAGKLKQNKTINSSSLVSLWQGEGNANDTRGINNGTLIGGTTFAAGRVGQAFQFSNTDHVSVPDSFSLDLTNALTIEAWVSPQQIGGAGNNTLLLFKGNSGVLNSQSYGLIYDSGGNIVFRIGNGSTIQQVFGGVLPLNTFTHIVATYDGTTMRFYVNGLLTSSAASSIGTILNTTDPLIIGSNAGIFNGKLDEVAIYNQALSQAEVRANYEAGNTLSTVVGDARITFPTVSTAGTTQQIPLNLSTLPSLPMGSTTTGLTYDIATTAVFTGSPQVCFNLPSFSNSTIFNNLRILHLESTVWINRTDLASISFATRTICTSGLTSLSPFAIVNGFAPTAAESSISGRVTTASGRGIGNATVQISGGNLSEPKFTRTNPFGNYRFTELDAGQIYVLNVASKRYSFANPSRVITLNEDLTGEDFVSDTK